MDAAQRDVNLVDIVEQLAQIDCCCCADVAVLQPQLPRCGRHHDMRCTAGQGKVEQIPASEMRDNILRDGPWWQRQQGEACAAVVLGTGFQLVHV